MYSILIKTQSIADKLQVLMDGITIKFKSSDNTNEYIEKKPKVYAFTYDDLNGDYPLDTPSVLVQFLSMDDSGSCSFCIYCCVCNPAYQSKEITYPLPGSEDTYIYGGKTFPDNNDNPLDDISIDSACVRSDLYKSCLMLGEQVFIAVKRMSNDDESISDVSLESPNPYMSEFPYCECIVKFTANLSMANSKINTKLWDLL